MPATDHIRNKLSQLPHKPGIYLMKDRFGTVIYVGKARDLRRRVSQYFHPSRRQGWDLKFNALVEAIHDLEIHEVRNEAEALLLEGRLIKEFHPRYNISFRDDKNFLLIKVNLNDPIPRFTLTRVKQEDQSFYYGPFAHSGSARKTLDLVRRQFLLRGCRVLRPSEQDYRHCLYAHLQYCTAPCIGNVSLADYASQVRAACEFLAGQCQNLVIQLEEAMKEAAARFDYEKAAQLRDAITDLRRTTQKTKSFDRIPYSLPLASDPQKDLLELARVLQLAGPPERIEGFDISNISGTFAVASLVCFTDGKPDRSNYRRFKIRTVAGQNDFACIAEAIRRRYTRRLKEITEQSQSAWSIPGESQTTPSEKAAPIRLPNLILVDGGKGQLNAALDELRKLELHHIPVVGLAKEHEEIHHPDWPEPLRLPADSNALKLLQRIRDESHRFANTFNAQLRLKRLSESILDEFPGIGQQRKMTLLRKFGSVQRLNMAPVEAIAAIPGLGGKTAEQLKQFLQARLGATPNPTELADPGQSQDEMP
ncbi:MAG TPA: excinuclease ABC subunit UvrC [Candidatus Paceibacterota bacterium]|nr:excinuclease ABC subunit UvrC [Candidatus Paceibacterota bacterium]HSA03492.1 excinuclease ABC subunit UvrC [Candidatus Paceibacterota bacterium]